MCSDSVTGARVLPLDGVHNFRDYGGYSVENGGRVKRGLLWRSGHHVDASDEDLARIDELELRHVIDFRGASERQAFPCRRSGQFAAEVVSYAGETANLAPHLEAANSVLDEVTAFRAMEEIYRNLPQRGPVLWVMREYFDVLARGEGSSLVHCFAGKDRTGMAVALLHHTLGVHPDDAMADFLLTNNAGDMEARIQAGAVSLRNRYGMMSDGTLRILMGVDARYLQAARAAIAEEFGSMDSFLEAKLGVTPEKREDLRLHLIEA